MCFFSSIRVVEQFNRNIFPIGNRVYKSKASSRIGPEFPGPIGAEKFGSTPLCLEIYATRQDNHHMELATSPWPLEPQTKSLGHSKAKAEIGSDWIGSDWIGSDWIGLDWMGLD